MIMGEVAGDDLQNKPFATLVVGAGSAHIWLQCSAGVSVADAAAVGSCDKAGVDELAWPGLPCVRSSFTGRSTCCCELPWDICVDWEKVGVTICEGQEEMKHTNQQPSQD